MESAARLQEGDDQRARMAREILSVLERLIAQKPDQGGQRDLLISEASWWATAPDKPLLDTVQRSFVARQLCIRAADSDGTWRNSLSYIGDPGPLDQAVCTYDYDRAEVRFTASSPLAQPYSWAASDELEVDAWYTRTGMSAITAWLVALARMAAERRRRHLVLTNRLYHETDILFDMARLNHVQVRRHDSCDELLEAASVADRPAVIFLDSSRPDGDAATLTRVLQSLDPERVGCVVWDNTCAPASDSPFGPTLSAADLPVALFVIRSHAKLDQLGLEFCSLGSMAQVSRPGASGLSPAWRDGMRRLMSDSLAVTGACASPATMRLLAALGLPNQELSAPANRCLREANVVGGEILALELDGLEGFRVEHSDHRCFVEIHLLDLPAPKTIGGPPTWPAWDELDAELTAVEQRAAERSIPVWKSASFGFHYTGLSWYASEDPPRPQGQPHTVLRICFGMHDPAVAREVAEMITDQLTKKQAWTASV